MAAGLVSALPGSSKADLMAYALASNAFGQNPQLPSTYSFGLFDLNTLTYTQLGAPNVSLAGLGNGPAGALYAVGSGTGTLYQVNTSNGALTTVGSNGLSYQGFGSTANGNLYALAGPADLSTLNLYQVNPTTAQATLVGPITQGGSPISGITGQLSTGGVTLGFFPSIPNFDQVDPSSGAITAVFVDGSIGYAGVWEGGSQYAEAIFDGVSDTLVGRPDPVFFTFDPHVFNANYLNNELFLSSLAVADASAPPPNPASPVPEPASIALLGSGLLLLGVVRRRTKGTQLP